MIRTLVFLLLPLLSQAATYYVCNGGTATYMEDGTTQCTHPTVNSALAVAQPFDTIIIKSGSYVKEDVKIGATRPAIHDITIKTSKIDEYPRDTRITRGHPALAKIEGVATGQNPISIGVVSQTATFSTSSTDVTFGSSFHGFNVGDQVVLLPTPIPVGYCNAVDDPITTHCSAGRVGFFYLRVAGKVANGMKVSFKTNSPNGLASGITQDVKYTVTNYSNVGGWDQFQLLDPNGNPVSVTSWVPNEQLPHLIISPEPFGFWDVAWVVYMSGSTIRLATTKGGAPVQVTQPGNVVSVTPYDQPYNITLDGLEVTNNPDVDQFAIIFVNFYNPRPECEIRGIRILRSWLYHDDDQWTNFGSSTSSRVVYLGARDSEIAYSVLEGAYTEQGADPQAIFVASRGNVSIHDNDLQSGGEVVFAGGFFPNFWPDDAQKISVKRNYFHKPMNWMNGISLSRVDNGTVNLMNVNVVTPVTCGTANASLLIYEHCFWVEGSDYPTPNWTRLKTPGDVQVTLSGGTTTGRMMVYAHNGGIRVQHTLTDGTVGCTACLSVAYTANFTGFPVGSSPIGYITVTSGAITSATTLHPNLKNNVETKSGSNWDVEGNLFFGHYRRSLANNQQFGSINLTVAANASGAGAAATWGKSNYIRLTNNVIMRTPTAVAINGKVFCCDNNPDNTKPGYINPSADALGMNMENNLLLDVGSWEWGYSPRGAMITFSGGSSSTTQQHNTCIMCRNDIDSSGKSSVHTTKWVRNYANVVIPYSKTGDVTAGVSQWNDYAGIITDCNENWVNVRVDNGDGCHSEWGEDASNTAGYNWLYTRGATGPPAFAKPYFMTPVPPYEPNYMPYSQAADIALTSAFVNWVDRPPNYTGWNTNAMWWLAMNPRLTSTADTARPTAPEDGRVIGADIDEIEALTGPWGEDVRKGLPQFSVRSNRQITPGTTTAALSYIPNGSDCQISLWSTRNYRTLVGTEKVSDATDPLVDGRKVHSFSGLTAGATYYGKRWCGQAVDVFSFTTAAALAPLTVSLAPPVGVTHCRLDYGTDANLGSTTTNVAVSSGTCSLSVPPTASHYRHVYLSGGGSSVYSRGAVTARGL